MKLLWLPFAIADRRNIYDYIDADSPSAAAMVDDRIWNTTSNLFKFPEIGRSGRIKGTRELVIQRTPYIVAYRIRGSAVEILRIFHGAQCWPRTLSKP